MSGSIDTSRFGQISIATLPAGGTSDPAMTLQVGRELNALAHEIDPPQLIVDLSELQWVSSAVLGVLVQADHIMKGRGGQLRLVAASPSVLEVLRVSGLDEVLRVCGTVNSAIASF